MFTYPGRRQPALDGVSLTVTPGSTIALVGPSGAGKTTVANLFLRFWDPTEGAVRLHGQDLRRYRLDDLRPGSRSSPRTRTCSTTRCVRTSAWRGRMPPTPTWRRR